MRDAVLLELVADGVDYPLRQQAEEEVRIRVGIALMVYGAQFEVRFQLPVSRLYLTDEVVVVPGGALVKRADVGAQEIGAEALLCLFLADYQGPSYVGHVGWVFFGAEVVYLIILGYGGIAALCAADALHHPVIRPHRST